MFEGAASYQHRIIATERAFVHPVINLGREEHQMTEIEHGKTILSAQEARQGKELGVMRYVLIISLALAFIAGLVLYALFFQRVVVT